MAPTPYEIAEVAATAADDKKASDIVLLDLTSQSDVCDYFLICTANNAPQMEAIIEAVEEKVLKNTGLKPLSKEGRGRSRWVLIDYGSVVVHVFTPEARDYYRLERLWGEAPQVKLPFQVAQGEQD